MLVLWMQIRIMLLGYLGLNATQDKGGADEYKRGDREIRKEGMEKCTRGDP